MARTTRLFGFSVRSHLLGALSCAVGGGIAMWIIAVGYVREVDTFAGGPAAFGTFTAAAAEAMRIMRWPADRLDTLGGYLTYHNVLLLPLLLGLYASVQGAQALRGAEEKRTLELWLASGRSRWAVAFARAAGFAVAMTIVALGVALGLVAATATGGAMEVAPSIVVAAEASLSAAVFYALAMLLSSVVTTSGTAAGVTALVMTALYLLNNVSDTLSGFAWLRFLSPFFYRQRSDVLIPGRELDLVATVALVVMWLALVVLAAAAFVRRDYAGTLWRRSERVRPRGPARLAWRPALWIGSLIEGRVGLLAWAMGAGVFMAMYAVLIPQVKEMWERMGFLKAFLPGGGSDVASQVVALAVEMLGPLVAAFAITQAARWAREHADGRDDLVLAQPVTRARLVIERLVALVVGALVVVAGAIAGLAIGAATVGGVALDAMALARTAADLALLALAVGGVAALAVAALRGGAVALLTAWIVAAYLVVLFAPLFDWPVWATRLSPFDAFGRPYLGAPDASGLASLAALAIAGGALAIAVLERRRAA